MKPPYFIMTGRCDHDQCSTGTFERESKQVTYKPEGCPTRTKSRIVCPGCGRLGTIISIREVTS